MNLIDYADAVHRAYPLLLVLATLSALVAIAIGTVTTWHAAGVVLTAFGVFWWLNYEG